MLITECLADLKTVKKRIESANETVQRYLARQEHRKDPLLTKGGSTLVIQGEIQSVRDLAEKQVQTRLAIARTNDQAKLTVQGVTRTVSEWLVWRREAAPILASQYKTIFSKIDQVRKEALKAGVQVTSGQPGNDNDVVIHVDEVAIKQESEKLDAILGELDGKLSIHNATTEMK